MDRLLHKKPQKPARAVSGSCGSGPLDTVQRCLRRTASWPVSVWALKTCVLLLFLFFTPAPVQAQPLELDADMAVEMALRNNLGIRTRELESMIAERNYSDRWNVFIPRISARGTLSRSNKEPENPNAELQETLSEIQQALGLTASEPEEPEDPPRWNLSTNFDVSLTLTRQMIVGLEQRSEALASAEMDLREARRETGRDVRLSFYELLLQQEQIVLAERRLENSRQRYEEAQEDYDAGVLDELTLLSAQVAFENQRPALRRRRQAYESALRQFALTIGAPPDEELELIGDISLETRELVGEQRLRSRTGASAEVRQARRAIRQLEIARESTYSDFFPSLTLGFNVDPGLTGDPFSSDIVDADQWDQQSGSFNISLSVPIDPLLPRSSTRTRIAEHEREIEQARISVQQASDGVEAQLLSLVETAEIAIESSESVSLNVELAERALSLAEEAYENGLREISAVRDAEIDLLDARLDLLQEQFNYREALINLEFLLDMELSELRESPE
ncbi:MAG: TolC family protein [Spirochaetia bacterium]